jgi:hypothetical protein
MYSVVALGTVVFAVAGRDVALEGVQVGAADGDRVNRTTASVISGKCLDTSSNE